MQVQAIKGNPQSFKANEMKEAFVNLDDNTLRTISAVKAEKETHYIKKHKFFKAVMLSTPIIAGIAAALTSPKLAGKAVLDSKFTQKMMDLSLPAVSGASARILNGLKSFGNLTSYLVAGIAAFGIKDKLAKKSEAVKKFDKENQFVTILAVGAAAFGAIIGIKKGAGALFKKIKPETVENMLTKLSQKAEKFNDTRVMKAISSGYNSLSNKLSPKVKDVAKNIIDYSPIAFIYGGAGGAIANNINYSNKFNKNYNELKAKQLELAQSEVEKAL